MQSKHAFEHQFIRVNRWVICLVVKCSHICVIIRRQQAAYNFKAHPKVVNFIFSWYDELFWREILQEMRIFLIWITVRIFCTFCKLLQFTVVKRGVYIFEPVFIKILGLNTINFLSQQLDSSPLLNDGILFGPQEGAAHGVFFILDYFVTEWIFKIILFFGFLF